MGSWTRCGMPELTHFLGPGIDEGSGTLCNRILRRNGITRELLAGLPKTSAFHQKMHARVPDMLAFQQEHYDIGVQFTYEIRPAPEAVLWANMRDKTRNVIRRAGEKHTVCDLEDPMEFIAFYRKNLSDRGVDSVYNDQIVSKLISESLKRNQGRMAVVRNSEGAISAGIYYVWDSRTGYFLLSTRDAASGNGVMSLLIWNAIKDCCSRDLAFDFEGIGTSGSVLFYTGFGGYVSPRFIARSSCLTYDIGQYISRKVRRSSNERFF